MFLKKPTECLQYALCPIININRYAQSKVKYGSLTVRNLIPHSSRKDILGLKNVYLCYHNINNSQLYHVTQQYN